MTSREIAARYAYHEDEADNDVIREQRAEFFKFHDAFARARPSRVARKQRDLSTQHPVHYLNVTKRPFVKESQARIQLPPDLQTLVDTQESNGTWKPIPPVLKVLEGNLGATPKPPDGVSEWRWVTVLVLVYMQRAPEHYRGLRRAFDKAARWNEDAHLKHRARKCLPPLPAYYYIDPEAIKAGTWKESTNQMMEDKG